MSVAINTSKWLWMMEYCRHYCIPPAQTWAWKKAESAWKAYNQLEED